MKNHPRVSPRHFLAFLLLAVLALFVTDALPAKAAPIQGVRMDVQQGTAQMVSPKGELPRDPLLPNYGLTLITVVVQPGPVYTGTFNHTTHTAIIGMSAASFAYLNTLLSMQKVSPDHHVVALVEFDAGQPPPVFPVTSWTFTLS